MEKEDEYEMVLGQNRENGLEIDKSKKNLFYIKIKQFPFYVTGGVALRLRA